jgi:hypothetical protein
MCVCICSLNDFSITGTGNWRIFIKLCMELMPLKAACTFC